MSQVLTGTTEKLRDILPGQIGVTWPTGTVNSLIMAADAATKERTQSWFVTEEISLEADEDTYDLGSSFISIKSVEYAADGTTYNGYLTPVTPEDLDKINYRWRADTGTEPEYFFLLGAPGLQADQTYHENGSQIVIYPKLSSVTAQKIKVKGFGIGATTDYVPDEVLDLCHVPYVAAMLTFHENNKLGSHYWSEFKRGCEIVTARYFNPLRETSY